VNRPVFPADDANIILTATVVGIGFNQKFNFNILVPTKSWEDVAALDWYVDNVSKLYINNATELAEFARLVNSIAEPNDFSDKTLGFID
jgi:hypothetical protein